MNTARVGQYESGRRLAVVGGHAINRCSVEGCTNAVMDGECCTVCADEMAALASMRYEQVRIEQQKRQAREMAEIQRGWRKSQRESWTREAIEIWLAFLDGARSLAIAIPGWVYGLGFVAVVNLFVWEYRGFILDWFSMWFGGRQ